MGDSGGQHRRLFYDKVGLSERTKTGLCDVSEKTRLQELLAQKPLPVERLRDFCSKSKVPDQYRMLVWKLVLDIVPRYANSCEFVRKQRELIYWDAWRTLLALRLSSIQWNYYSTDAKSSSCSGGFYKPSGEATSGGVGGDDLLRWTSSGFNAVTRTDSDNFFNRSLYSSEDSMFGETIELFNSQYESRSATSATATHFLGSDLPLVKSPTQAKEFSLTNGHHRHQSEVDISPKDSSAPDNRPTYAASSLDVGNQLARNNSRTTVLEQPQLVSYDERSKHHSNPMLDAKIYGIYTIKNHYIGFVSTEINGSTEWDFDAKEAPIEKVIPTVVDMLLMWMMNRGNLPVYSHCSVLINNVKYAAYLTLGSQLQVDSKEDTFALRFAVWDLLSSQQHRLIEAVTVTGKTILSNHNSTSQALHQVLQGVDFFTSPYLHFYAISLFSNLLSPVSTDKVLDKVFAQCFEYLGYLFMELLMQARTGLSTVKSSEEAVRLLADLKPLESECAVNNSLDIWHKLHVASPE